MPVSPPLSWRAKRKDLPGKGRNRLYASVNAANCWLPTGKVAATCPKARGHLEKLPTPETVQTIDLQRPSHEQKQEHSIDPGYYYGISR